MMRHYRYLAAGVVLAVCLGTPSTTWAQVAPPLGTAARFGALANSGVTGAAGAGVVVTGDVGSSPTPTITNFPPSSTVPPFIVHNSNNGVVQQARIDAIAAYNNLQGQGPGTVLADNLGGGVTLTSGIYSFVTGTPNLPAGQTLTLNGGGVFIFNVGASLTFNVNSVVAGTANPCNIFWRIGVDATLNGVNFRGTVIADRSITVGVSSNVQGRLLAGTGATGAITMAGAGGNTIGGCSVAAGACPAITLQPTAVPNGTVGVGYGQPITASGGTGPYTFTTPNALPSGITLTSAGLLGGTPTDTTPQTFTITATDAALCLGSRTYTMSIVPSGGSPPAPGCPVITLSPTTLPNGAVGAAYNQTITASGGAAPYTFTLVAGSLPSGLTLTTAGVISGTPTRTAPPDTFTIRATAANGCTAELVYLLGITIGVPTLPQVFLLLLALGLMGIGYFRLRPPARV